MGKLRLDINSNNVQGIYSIVDIVFNDIILAPLKQLSATVESLEYDVDILTSSDNILKVALLNSQAYDADGDGNFDNPEAGDQAMNAIVSALSYSIDGVNFTTLLPQQEVTHTVPSGDNAGDVWILTFANENFISSEPISQLEFNKYGIVTNEYIKGVRVKQLEDGTFQIVANGVIKDANWVTIANWIEGWSE